MKPVPPRISTRSGFCFANTGCINPVSAAAPASFRTSRRGYDMRPPCARYTAPDGGRASGRPRNRFASARIGRAQDNPYVTCRPMADCAATVVPYNPTSMATIRKEILIDTTPEKAWDALRDVGALHTRLVAGFVVDTKLEGSVRVVTFKNG